MEKYVLARTTKFLPAIRRTCAKAKKGERVAVDEHKLRDMLAICDVACKFPFSVCQLAKC